VVPIVVMLLLICYYTFFFSTVYYFFFLLLSFELLIIIDLCYNFLDDKVGSAKSTTPKDKTYSKSTLGRGTTNFPANPYFCTHAWDTKLQESLVHRLIFE
jgi:hypothetical protein